jgi:pyruvate dehydrogenase E1 component alpha subunit
MDVFVVYDAAEEAVKRARDGKGPTIIECKTYRWQGHHVGDPGDYRLRKDKKEKEKWQARCPVKCFRIVMLEAGIAEGKIAAVEAAVEEEIQAAVKFAADSPYPDMSEAFEHVFLEV